MEIDYKELYEELKKKLEEELPIKTYPIKELVQIFRKNEMPITLKTQFQIASVLIVVMYLALFVQSNLLKISRLEWLVV